MGIAIEYLVSLKEDSHGGMPIKDWFNKKSCAMEIVINFPMINITIYKEFNKRRQK